MATVAAITDFKLPAKSAEDSYDFLSAWKANSPGPRRTIVHNTHANAYALRHEQWLYIAAKTGAVSQVPAWFDAANAYAPHSEPGELYDLGTDLGQHHNLHAAQPAKVAELRALLENVRAHGQVR
jgi:arylsulfatase A